MLSLAVPSVTAIETIGLTKHYGPVRALCDLNLAVPAGSLFGFLGPNGAGKTTTLRLLLDLIRPTAGRATVLGLDARRDSVRIRSRVGYLPGDLRLYDRMTGRQALGFCAAVRGCACGDEIARLGRRFDLDLDRRVRGCSKGARQKIGLAAALMHRPEVIILDEPTASLDPLMQQELYGELRDAAGRGATVLFSSHVLAEVEALCESVAIVRGGRLVEQARIDDLRRRAVRRVEYELSDGSSAPPPPPNLTLRSRVERRYSGTWAGPTTGLVSWLAAAGAIDVRIGPPDLEELFLAYYDRRRPDEIGSGAEIPA